MTRLSRSKNSRVGMEGSCPRKQHTFNTRASSERLTVDSSEEEIVVALVDSDEEVLPSGTIGFLPDEIWCVVFANLDPWTFLRLREVSRFFRRLVDLPHVLYTQLIYYYGRPRAFHSNSSSSLAENKTFCAACEIFGPNKNHSPEVLRRAFRGNMEGFRERLGSSDLVPRFECVSGDPSEQEARESFLEGWSARLCYLARHGHCGLLLQLEEAGRVLLTPSERARVWNEWRTHPRLMLSFDATPLFLAALNGLEDVVQAILSRVDALDLHAASPTHRSTPLYVAAFAGHENVVRQLAKAGASVHYRRPPEGTTALLVATKHRRRKVVRALLELGADPKQRKEDGTDALYEAVRQGDRGTLLLLAGLKDCSSSSQKNSSSDRHGGQPAPRAVEPLDGGSPTRTLLNLAATCKRLSMVQLLLSEPIRADPNGANADGTTPAYVASYQGNLPLLSLLVQRGANPNAARRDGMCPLAVALQEKQVDAVRFLLSFAWVDLTQRRADGATLEYIAARSGNPAMLQLLWQAMSAKNMLRRVNEPRHDGVTALSVCSQHGFTSVVDALLRAGADATLADFRGVTPLLMASQEGHLEVVSLLCDSAPTAEARRALIHRVEPSGISPLFSASQQGHGSVVLYLLNLGADPNMARLVNGDTPLHAAIANHRPEVLPILLKHGADPFRPRLDGLRPCDLAFQMGLLDSFSIPLLPPL